MNTVKKPFIFCEENIHDDGGVIVGTLTEFDGKIITDANNIKHFGSQLPRGTCVYSNHGQPLYTFVSFDSEDTRFRNFLEMDSPYCYNMFPARIKTNDQARRGNYVLSENSEANINTLLSDPPTPAPAATQFSLKLRDGHYLPLRMTIIIPKTLSRRLKSLAFDIDPKLRYLRKEYRKNRTSICFYSDWYDFERLHEREQQILRYVFDQVDLDKIFFSEDKIHLIINGYEFTTSFIYVFDCVVATCKSRVYASCFEQRLRYFVCPHDSTTVHNHPKHSEFD